MKLKILHTVESYLPARTGMSEVARQISERLVEKGHDVTIATSELAERKDLNINGVKIEEFGIKGNIVRGLKGDKEKYIDYILKSDFDIISNFAAQQWATDLVLPLLSQLNSKKVFIPTGFSGLYLRKYKNYYNKMAEWMKLYDMNVFLSEKYRDIEFARHNGLKNIKVIPNGADEKEFLEDTGIDFRYNYGIDKDDFMILHVGSRTGFKGHSEALSIFSRANINNSILIMIGNEGVGLYKSLMKIFDVKLVLFNKSLSQKVLNKKVIVLNLSREETVQAFKEADLFLFPSNIECSPLVLFECLASKTPFLVTDVGNSSEIIEWSDSGFLMPTKIFRGLSKAKIKESVTILEQFYHNREMRVKMAESGFNEWQKRFTWEKIADDYEKLYLSLMENSD
ncbi:MAG: glycosyltransferase family 1 protein [Bacteroidetes bacterium]|nr:MAG: glycosyltransferase family 1 protein [Bacteroidota bacterium]